MNNDIASATNPQTQENEKFNQNLWTWNRTSNQSPNTRKWQEQSKSANNDVAQQPNPITNKTKIDENIPLLENNNTTLQTMQEHEENTTTRHEITKKKKTANICMTNHRIHARTHMTHTHNNKQSKYYANLLMPGVWHTHTHTHACTHESQQTHTQTINSTNKWQHRVTSTRCTNRRVRFHTHRSRTHRLTPPHIRTKTN